MAYLSGFQEVVPRYLLPQEKSIDWIAKAHALAESAHSGIHFEGFYQEILRRLRLVGTAHKKIQQRGFQMDDIVHEEWEKMEIYPVTTHPSGKAFKERIAFFQRQACDIFNTFYPESSPLPKHLIHVTCTGYYSPSAAQVLAAKRGGKTTVTHAYHMGCYASLPALRMALSMEEAEVVHTELCTLHMNPLLHSTEQLVIHSLFADGYVKYRVSKTPKEGLQLLALHEELLPDSSQLMSWSCDSHGMHMTLAKEVPEKIGERLPGYVHSLIQKAGIDPQQALFAIHPGGPKIIQQVSERLQLKPHQSAHSEQVLSERGNMSSATLPLIWMRMLQDPQVSHHTPVVSLAFGPGLTLSGGVFKKCIS